MLAFTMAVLAFPLMVLTAIAIWLESGGPVLYCQERVGENGRLFTLCKFRSMRIDAEQGTPIWAKDHDDRVTRVGRIIRLTRLDELPQIWNVLRGEMSLVGPRPPLHYEVEHYRPAWFGRFAVKPGLTGLWQVSGRCELSVEEMIALDLEYVRRRSLWTNVKILARTLPVVFLGRGAA